MNQREQDHIVRFLTAFSRRRQDSKDYYLMFEWADGGTLRNLWEAYPRPELSAPLVKAAIQQIRGLARALAAAHYLDNRGASYRHGDLKPANILRFQGDTIIGRLKIGDWGEAKEHNNVTEFRFSKTTARYATWRYAAPEVVVGVDPRYLGQSKQRRSRLYDVWAMGCITLEFIIWLLYGFDGLKRFNREFPDQSPFYQLGEENGERVAKVHDVVTRWMDHIAKERICQLDTALGRLFELVKTGLLVVKLPRRTGTNLRNRSRSSSLPIRSNSAPSSSQISTADHLVQLNPEIVNGNLTGSPKQTLAESITPMSDMPSLLITPAELPVIEITGAPAEDTVDPLTKQPLVPVESKGEPPGPARFLATEFESRMEDILTGDEEGESYWFIDAPRSMPLDDPNHLAYKGSGEDTSPSTYISGPESNSRALSKTTGHMALPEVEKVC